MRSLFNILILLLFSTSVCVYAQGTENEIKKYVLDNGLTVLIRQEEGSNLVAISAMVKAGTTEETIMNAGTGNFVAQLLLASTTNSSADKIATIADSVGGNIDSQWHQDYTEVKAITTSSTFNETISLMAECIMHADFDKSLVNQTRESLLKLFVDENASPFEQGYSKLRDLMYQDNGYRRAPYGLERVLRLITPEDLRKFHATYYVPNNTVIAIAGDIEPGTALERAKLAFAGWVPKALPKRIPIPDEKMEMFRSYVAEADINLAYLMLGWLSPSVSSDDYAAVAVAGNALGGGKGSLMFTKLRQEMGMGYEIGTAYPRLRNQSHLFAYVATDPFKFDILHGGPAIIIDELKSNLLNLVSTMRSTQLTERELRRAKGFTIGQFARSHQHLYERASDLAWLETIGVGYDMYLKFSEEVEKVTAEDVQKIARKYFDKYAVVVILPRGSSE